VLSFILRVWFLESIDVNERAGIWKLWERKLAFIAFC
jgi:hypothetical protein